MSSATVLDSHYRGVRADVAAREAASFPSPRSRRWPRTRRPPLDVMAALREPGHRGDRGSEAGEPVARRLASISDPAKLARAYEEGGARIISVLTQQRRFFNGSLDDLDAVRGRAGVNPGAAQGLHRAARIQIHEARAQGADMLLLIVAALEQSVLVSMRDRTESLGMTALVEVHTEEEADRALQAGAKVIGVNARDLKTLDVDRDCFARIAPGLPSNVIRVAESGVRGTADLLAYAGARRRRGARRRGAGHQWRSPRRRIADLVTAGTHPSCHQTRALTHGGSRRPGFAAFQCSRGRTHHPRPRRAWSLRGVRRGDSSPRR